MAEKILYANSLMPYVEGLDIGESKRFTHCPWCGLGSRGKVMERFVATRQHNQYLFHCFSCNRTTRIRQNKLPISGVLHSMNSRRTGAKEALEIERSSIRLPSDFTDNLPKHAIVWLNKYNISPIERTQFRIGYSPMLDRVIIPVYLNDTLVYWQGRRLGELNGSPKYINLRRKFGNKPFFSVTNDSDTLVLVEDVLSAIAVSRTGCSAMALLGTHLPDEAAMKIKEAKVFVWLDPDKKSLAQKTAKRLRAYGKAAKAIVSHKKDPKEYKPEELKAFMKKTQ